MTPNKVISTDLLVRFLHLVLILSFAGAYLTGEEEEWHHVHMAFGYTLAIALTLRILWQFFAPTIRTYSACWRGTSISYYQAVCATSLGTTAVMVFCNVFEIGHF